MIKVTYNRSHPLAFRFISHLDETETQELVQKNNASRDSRRTYSQEQPQPFRTSHRKKSEISQQPFASQQTKVISEFGVPHFGGRMDMPLQSRFEDIDSNRRMKKSETIIKGRKDSFNDPDTSLLEFVSQENSNLHSLRQAYLRLWFQRMALENSYQSLRGEGRKEEPIMGMMRQQESKAMFYNPQGGQNKTAIIPSHSNSMQNHPLNSHWGSVHPRNFNVTTTRSNM